MKARAPAVAAWQRRGFSGRDAITWRGCRGLDNHDNGSVRRTQAAILPLYLLSAGTKWDSRWFVPQRVVGQTGASSYKVQIGEDHFTEFPAEQLKPYVEDMELSQ